jgi:hypothetical protein
MAAECCVFLKDSDFKLERWKPYIEWATALTQNDTIITFNYDRVPDLLSKLQTESGRQPFDIPVPTNVGEFFAVPRVLKLHGSVSWHLASQGLAERSDEEALACPHTTQFGMATPGPTKREMIEGTITLPLHGNSKVQAPLKPLWDAAEIAIREAFTIVIVGYRIPPSDAYTRKWLIDALRTNKRMNSALGPRPDNQIVFPGPPPKTLPAKDPLVVHTILGSNVNHEHSRRLKGMLEEVDPEGRIEVKPWAMFAEDFLAVANRQRLLKPV